MLWLAWRQQRVPLLILGSLLLLALAYFAVWLTAFRSAVPAECAAFMNPTAGPPDLVRSMNLTPCQRAIFEFEWAWDPRTSVVAFALLALPAAVGIFIGAPLVAAEREGGTHAMLWTQGVTRRRWFLTKVGVAIGGSVLFIAILGVSLVLWLPNNQAPVCCDPPPWELYDVVGVVPAAFAAFAISCGALCGTLTKRTLPAMAGVLVLFSAIRIVFTGAARPWLMPPIPMESLDGLRPAAGWSMAPTYFLDSSGNEMSAHEMTQVFAAAPHASSLTDSMAYLHEHGYHLMFTIQPNDRFWTFQAIESAVFAVLTGLLVGVTLLVLSKRFE